MNAEHKMETGTNGSEIAVVSAEGGEERWMSFRFSSLNVQAKITLIFSQGLTQGWVWLKNYRLSNFPINEN